MRFWRGRRKPDPIIVEQLVVDGTVSFSVKRPNRVYKRKFDWYEARRRHANGETYSALAREYGVSATAVQLACNDEMRRKVAERSAAYQKSGVCEVCGKQCSYNASTRGVVRCRSCASDSLVTTVRPTELRCVRCKEWKSDESFPHDRNHSRRRYRHRECTDCNTLYRHEYREQRRVPCSHGCGALVLHEQHRDKPYECHACAMKRIGSERGSRIQA